MLNPTTTRPRHGTVTRHYAHGCHCLQCLSNPSVARLAARADMGIARLPRPVVDLTVPHGYLRYRDQGCRCLTCVDGYKQRRRDVLARKHQTAGCRPNGCLCATCTTARTNPIPEQRHEKPKERVNAAKHGSRRRYAHHGCRCDLCREWARKTQQAHRDRAKTRTTPQPAVQGDPWRFEAYAAHPAQPPTVTTTAKSVICCEREASEDEGAGHFDCPLAATSNHGGGDTA